MRGSDTPSSWELRKPLKDQKGPNGRPLCTWCQKEVPTGRRTWCSHKCVDQYRMATDWQYLSSKIYERDKGICQSCGVDTKEIREQLNRDQKEMKERREWPCYPKGYFRRTYDIDHIIPVEDGGKSIMENLQTLCVACHKKKTAEQARNKALRKREMPMFQQVVLL